jgi:desulfoferrodoxin-like iron-binding protein
MAGGRGGIVHWPSDPARLSGLELDHVPLLRITEPTTNTDVVELEVKVGKRPHPMSNRHSLKWVEIFVNDKKLCELRIYKTGMAPQWRFSLVRTSAMRIVVRVGCNVHGVWANRLIL